MPRIKTLPGAEQFFEYLKKLHAGKTLTITGPVVLDVSYGIEYAKAYEIRADGIYVGTYKTFGPDPGEKKLTLEFAGFIPGYLNEAAVINNQYLRKGDRPMKLNSVSLCFGNEHFESSCFDGPGRIVKTPWQRQDGHDTIPFP